MPTLTATITDIKHLTPTIVEWILQPSTYINYQPGQYLKLNINSPLNTWVPFSIANMPNEEKTYHLHIRQHPEHSPVLPGMCFPLAVPFGQCHVDALATHKPIILIAGGTGFSPIKAMLETLMKTQDKRPITLIWAVRKAEDLYFDDVLQTWAKAHSTFCYLPVISQPSNLLATLFSNNTLGLQNASIVLSGPYDMVWALHSALIDIGISPADMYGDAL